MATGLEQSHSWPALRPWLLGWGLVGDLCLWQEQLFPRGGVKFQEPSFVLYFKNMLHTGSSVLCWENVNTSFKLMSLHFPAFPPAPWCILFHPGTVLHLFGGDFKLGQHITLKPRTETPGHNHTINTTDQAIKTPIALKLSHPTWWF